MSAGEVAQLVAEALTPVLSQMGREHDERIARIMVDAQQHITRLDTEIAQLRTNQQDQAQQQRPQNDRRKSMMEQKAFTRIEKFKDGQAKWRSVRAQIENLAEMAYPNKGRKILKWARSLGSNDMRYNEEQEAFIGVIPPNPATHEDAYNVGQDLAVTLSYLLDGEAEAILCNAGEGFGLDAWRRLQQRFDPRSKARDLVDTQRIVKPPQCRTMSDILPALERWEEALRQMNEANRPPPLIKMGIAIGMCPPKLQEYLQDQEDRLQTYADLRAEIIRKVDLSEVTKEYNTKHDKNGPSPMDIGGLSGQHSDPAEWWNVPPGIPDEWNWNVPEGGEVDLAALYAKGKGKGKKGNPWEMKGAWGSWKGGKSPWKGSPGKGEAKGSKGGGKGSGKNQWQFSGGGKGTGSGPVAASE